MNHTNKTITINTDKEEILEFDSLNEAASFIGATPGRLSSASKRRSGYAVKGNLIVAKKDLMCEVDNDKHLMQVAQMFSDANKLPFSDFLNKYYAKK